MARETEMCVACGDWRLSGAGVHVGSDNYCELCAVVAVVRLKELFDEAKEAGRRHVPGGDPCGFP